MNNIELRTLPSKVVFTIWLQQLLSANRARFSKTHESVIELNTGICSMFAFGRHQKTNHPIIAAPKSLIPWFFMGKINRAIISKKDGIFLEFGSEGSAFFVCLKCSRRRLECLTPFNEESQDLVKTVDFHGYIVTGEKTVEITKPLNRAPIICVDSLDEIIPPKEQPIYQIDDILESDFDILNVGNFEKLRDPLNF